MQKKSEDFSLEDVQRLAGSPAAQQLIALFQRTDPAALSKAVDQASAGNYQQAKDALAKLLSNEEAKSLLAQLGGSADG